MNDKIAAVGIQVLCIYRIVGESIPEQIPPACLPAPVICIRLPAVWTEFSGPLRPWAIVWKRQRWRFLLPTSTSCLTCIRPFPTLPSIPKRTWCFIRTITLFPTLPPSGSPLLHTTHPDIALKPTRISTGSPARRDDNHSFLRPCDIFPTRTHIDSDIER